MKEIKKSASFTSKQKGKDVKFNIDLNYSPEYDSFIIKVKEGEGFMAYSSNIERMPLEVIQKLNEMLEEVLIKAGSKTEMKEHKMFDGGKVDSKMSIAEVEKIANETANALGSEFSVTKDSVDTGTFDLDYMGEKYYGGSYLIMENGDVVNVALPKTEVYYNYKTKKKADLDFEGGYNYKFGGDFQSGVYERGGRFQTTKTITEIIKDGYYVSDAFDTYKQAENVCDIKDLQSGKVVIVRDKNYFTIAEKRKKYDDGGSLNSKVNTKWRNLALENFNSKNYKNLQVELGAEPSYIHSNKKHQNKIKIKPYLVNVNSLEEATKIFQDFNKDNDLNKYNIIGGDIYADKEIVGRIDENGRFHDYKYESMRFVNDKLTYDKKYDYPEDKNFANGGAMKNERLHVNKDEDYEVRYSKPRPHRKGYKGLRNFDGGGEMDLTDDKRLRVRKPVMPERKMSEQEWAEKHNPRAYEYMTKRKMATGGGVGLVGNQKRIDMNKNGKIDAEDFKLLRSSMNGAWRNERKHVNHNEDYEVRYAKPRPKRTGYKGKRNFMSGGKMKKAESGTEVKKGVKGGIMTLAKKIRKDGESWQDAVKRAGQQLK